MFVYVRLGGKWIKECMRSRWSWCWWLKYHSKNIEFCPEKIYFSGLGYSLVAEQHSRNLVFGYWQIFFHTLTLFCIIWSLEKWARSQSVHLVRKKWARSVQQYSEKPWNMAYSRYPKMAISGIIRTRSATKLLQQQHRAQLL